MLQINVQQKFQNQTTLSTLNISDNSLANLQKGCLYFDPKPNHFAKENTFFPREVGGAAVVAFAGNELGLAVRLKLRYLEV